MFFSRSNARFACVEFAAPAALYPGLVKILDDAAAQNKGYGLFAREVSGAMRQAEFGYDFPTNVDRDAFMADIIDATKIYLQQSDALLAAQTVVEVSPYAARIEGHTQKIAMAPPHSVDPT